MTVTDAWYKQSVLRKQLCFKDVLHLFGRIRYGIITYPLEILSSDSKRSCNVFGTKSIILLRNSLIYLSLYVIISRDAKI